MDTETDAVAGSFCKLIAGDSSITNAHARMGAWLIGAASMTGGFPLELTYFEIQKGFERDGVKVEGTGSRYETIRAAIDALVEAGVLTVEEGKHVAFGYNSKIFTMLEV